MPDTAEILAQPHIIEAIKALITRAMSDAGIMPSHCIRATIGLGDRIMTGEPVAEAVALIDDIISASKLTEERDFARLVSMNLILRFRPDDQVGIIWDDVRAWEAARRAKIAEAIRSAYVSGLTDDGDKFTTPDAFVEQLMNRAFPVAV
jgi:hypothetical protein